MAIYIFSQTVGVKPDDMNYIQKYKEQIIGKTSATIKYIFSAVPEPCIINPYKKIGIDVGQLVCMYQYFTDNHTLNTSIKTKEKLKELKSSLHYTNENYCDTEILLLKGRNIIAAILLDKENKDCFWGIRYFKQAKLLRMEIYTNYLVYANSYVTAKSKNGLYAKLVKRTFYNEDGSVAYDQIFEDEKEYFLFPDGSIYTKLQFIAEFIKRLRLSNKDIIVLDETVLDEFTRYIFTFGKAARIIAMTHVGKHLLKSEKIGEAFWRGYYYCWFPYIEQLDTIVVSTEEQKKKLIKELEKYHCNVPDIRVISIVGEFLSTVLYESFNGNLALSWTFNGKTDGFLVYDEFGTKICETRNIYQHYFLIKGYPKETGFVLKAFSDTVKGKMIIAESKMIRLCMRRFEKPVVSLIIPAYNAEKYIARTIDNALAQSFSDLEIIIVDDGSTDSTPDIIDWYTEKNINVVGIHKENGGTPAARNEGIEHAQGQYIGFMDNDDMIRPDMIARLYGSAEKNDCDIAVTSVYTITNNGYVSSVQYTTEENEGILADEFFPIFIRGSELGVVVWNKLYRAALVKKYKFPIMPYDDVAWTPYILLYAEKICYLNGHFYEWDRTIRNSTLLSEWNHYKKDDMFEFRKTAILFYLENGNVKKRGLLKESAKRYLLLWKKVYGYEKYGELWEWINKTF